MLSGHCVRVLSSISHTSLRYYSWKHSEMLRLGCGGWVTETGDSQLQLLDAWQVQPHRGV